MYAATIKKCVSGHAASSYFAIAFVMAATIVLSGTQAFAAASATCTGGVFTVLGRSGKQDVKFSASIVPSTFLVKGKYVEFTVDTATFGVRNWRFTGAANELDITGGIRTVVFASKIPNHRGLALNCEMRMKLDNGGLVLTRTGRGLDMKIQAKDCAQVGIFQMEVERGDQTATVFTNVLGEGVFYYDNPNVRKRLGERIPCSGVLPDGTLVSCEGANPDGTVTVTARVNFGNDLPNKFVGRDSAQVATRIATGCPNNIPNPFNPGTVNHCGGVSQWIVASGGRVGKGDG